MRGVKPLPHRRATAWTGAMSDPREFQSEDPDVETPTGAPGEQSRTDAPTGDEVDEYGPGVDQDTGADVGDTGEPELESPTGA